MLNKKFKEVKELYYDHNSKIEYVKKCSQKIELEETIKLFCQEHNIGTIDMRQYLSPSACWYFTIPIFKTGEFEVEYTTVLKISKLTTIYSLLHCFDVKDKNPKRMFPELSGSSDETYTFLQYDFAEVVAETLSELGYERLSWAEGERKIEGLKFSDDTVIYGPDVTVSDILYLDVLDILPDNE